MTELYINSYKIISTRSAEFNQQSIIEYLRKSWFKLCHQFLHVTWLFYLQKKFTRQHEFDVWGHKI